MAASHVAKGVVALEELQALAVHSFSSLDAACYLLGRIDDSQEARHWLASRLPAISCGKMWANPGLNIAFTSTGLARLGLPAKALEGFCREFREGMVTENRQHILGDLPGSSNDPDLWDWGSRPECEVHILLMLYADPEQAAAIFAKERKTMEASGIWITAELNAMLLEGGKEHFGFSDGIAQPAIRGLGDDSLHAVQPGELFLGYPNESGQNTPSPHVAANLDVSNHLQPTNDTNLRDLGINGSYLVFRQLEQDVQGFWHYLAQLANRDEGGVDCASQIALAAKMVGRWPNGVPLVFDRNYLRPEEEKDASKLDDFGYVKQDALGLLCPIGAHIRRANPRDSAIPSKPEQSSITIKKHRILRRGRPYGPPADSSVFPEGLNVRTRSPFALGEDTRGLHFIGLVGNLARQFEFAQQNWVNNPKFGGLYSDPDPLLGTDDRQFVVPGKPVRNRFRGLPRFVTVRGGAYFFLPSIRALHFLAALQ